ncbi:MAG: AI-2E family transporter [Magnetospirillum sp. WYHS-4]
MTTARDASARAWFWLAAFLVAAGLIYLLREMLMPFLAGMAVAYFLDPLADRLEAKGASRGLAVSLILGGFFISVGLALALLAPPLQAQIVQLAARLPDVLAAVRDWAAPLLQTLWDRLSPDEVAKLKGAAESHAGEAITWLGGIARRILSGGLAVFSILSLLIVTPVVSFYLLRDYDRIVAWLDGTLPRDAAPAIREQAAEIDRTVAAFVRGQGLICLIDAAYYGLALTLVGLDFGLLIGIVTGALSFVPFVGGAIGILAGLAVALFQGEGVGLIVKVLAVFAVWQGIESYMLQPKLVGEKVGLHPVWLIFSIMAGGVVFGFTGVLLAVPVAAAIGVLLRYWLARYKASRLYLGRGA